MKNEYKAKINGRGNIKLYGDSIPKFFCVLDVDGVCEKKAMITVSDVDRNNNGNFYSNDPISLASKGDMISFKISNINLEKAWLNIDSSDVEIIDDSGSKEWQKQREAQKEAWIKAREEEREIERKQKEEERNEKKRIKQELHKKLQKWYLETYGLKTTGATIILMYKTLSTIKHNYSLLGNRGKKGDGWVAPTGLHADVFHGLNSKITEKVLLEITNNGFGEIKKYKVITREPRSGIETTSLQKGLNITQKGLEYISNFLLIE